MKALQINQLMINIEEKINILEHRLDIDFDKRQDRANNHNGQIKARIHALNRAWDELELEFLN